MALLFIVFATTYAQVDCGSNPCQSVPGSCRVKQTPDAVCRGTQFELTNSTSPLQDTRRASSGTAYYCCGNDCACSSENSCFKTSPARWKTAEQLPGFYKLAETVRGSGDNKDDRGWRIYDSKLTADFGVDDCYFNFFWCRDCSEVGDPPLNNCGGRQTACGAGYTPCSASDVCHPDCQGDEKWPDNSNEPLDGAAHLTIRQTIVASPVPVQVVAGSNAVFDAAFEEAGCGLTTVAWYQCSSACTFSSADTLLSSGFNSSSTGGSERLLSSCRPAAPPRPGRKSDRYTGLLPSTSCIPDICDSYRPLRG